jgi:hypothetical protein
VLSLILSLPSGGRPTTDCPGLLYYRNMLRNLKEQHFRDGIWSNESESLSSWFCNQNKVNELHILYLWNILGALHFLGSDIYSSFYDLVSVPKLLGRFSYNLIGETFHLMLSGTSHSQPYWSIIKHTLHTFSKWTFPCIP